MTAAKLVKALRSNLKAQLSFNFFICLVCQLDGNKKKLAVMIVLIPMMLLLLLPGIFCSQCPCSLSSATQTEAISERFRELIEN